MVFYGFSAQNRLLVNGLGDGSCIFVIIPYLSLSLSLFRLSSEKRCVGLHRSSLHVGEPFETWSFTHIAQGHHGIHLLVHLLCAKQPTIAMLSS